MSAAPIGRLRRRVRIERPLRSADDGGGATVTWQTLATVWAGIACVGGDEIDFAHAVSARTTYNIVLRHRDDVDAAMRIVDGDRIFDITSVRDVDGMHQWLNCSCELQGP